jgi:hypothetical protein
MTSSRFEGEGLQLGLALVVCRVSHVGCHLILGP